MEPEDIERYIEKGVAELLKKRRLNERELAVLLLYLIRSQLTEIKNSLDRGR